MVCVYGKDMNEKHPEEIDQDVIRRVSPAGTYCRVLPQIEYFRSNLGKGELCHGQPGGAAGEATHFQQGELSVLGCVDLV